MNITMDDAPDAVNGRRPYDATGRRQQARRNREAIITVAVRRFLGDGYAATTVASIAAEAGVSTHTIYKSFGGKPGLIRAIRARALEGEGPVPAEERSDQLHTADATAEAILDGWGALTAEIAPLVAPILLLVRDAAAADPEVRALQEELDEDRLRRMTDNARRLLETGQVRPSISLERVADLLWTYSAPELYELLVARRHWSTGSYARFVSESLTSALL